MSKYLFFDVDGTLRGKSRMIHEKTKTALRHLQQEGHKLFICSGRSPAALKGPIVQEIAFDGIIACAGGCILVNGQWIFEHDIERSLLRRVLKTFQDMNILYSLETRDALYQPEALTAYYETKRRLRCQDHPEILKKFEEENRDFIYRPMEAFDDTVTGVPKLSFVSWEPNCFEQIRPMLEESFHIVLFSQSDQSIDGELIPRTCTKADGIQKILDYFHADWKDTIAFGDSMNDYQMIRSVHTGVVYEHAPEELKRQAKFFFRDPDDAGIYHALADMGLL